MNSFKFDFSKLFWGGSHRAPPQTPPLVFSSDFALNSHTLRAFNSGFALEYRAFSPLDQGFDLSTCFAPPI